MRRCTLTLRLLLGAGCLGGALSAHASYVASFYGGYENQSTSRYASAFTTNGLPIPSAGATALGFRLGNEDGTGLIRLSLNAMGVKGVRASATGSEFGEVAWNRWGGMAQVNLFPMGFLGVTLGGELGMGFARTLVMGTAANGVIYEKYGYISPVLGLELSLGTLFKLFAEASYPTPFSVKADPQGDALGVGGAVKTHWALSAGLHFYFSQ